MKELDEETTKKFVTLYNGLQEALQDCYRKSMVPLSYEDYCAWFSEIQIYGKLTCYAGYWYKQDLETPTKYCYYKVCVYPEDFPTSYMDDLYAFKFNKKKNIVIESYDYRYKDRFIKSYDRWDEGIQLYLDSESTGYHKVYSYDKIQAYWKNKMQNS